MAKNIEKIDNLPESGQSSQIPNTSLLPQVNNGQKNERKATMDSSTQFDVITEAFSANKNFMLRKEHKQKMRKRKIRDAAT